MLINKKGKQFPPATKRWASSSLKMKEDAMVQLHPVVPYRRKDEPKHLLSTHLLFLKPHFVVKYLNEKT